MLSREYPSLYIDGGWQEPDSTERFDVISPATGEKIGFVPAANDADIDRAVEAARKAFYETDWPTRPVERARGDDGAAGGADRRACTRVRRVDRG